MDNIHRFRTFADESDRTYGQATSLFSIVYIAKAVLGAFSLLPYGLLASVLMAVALIDLMLAVDETPGILQIAGVIATLQNVFGPFVLYAYFNTDPRYRMYVDAISYFPFAIPSTCAFLIAMKTRVVIGNVGLRVPVESSHSFKLGITLVAVGLIATISMPYLPGSVAFLLYLIANLRYVGAIAVYRSGHELRWPVVIAVLGGLYFSSSHYGMFHELILWGSLAGSYWFIHQHRSITIKLVLFSAALLAIIVLQLAKPILRAELKMGNSVSLIDTAAQVVADEHFDSLNSMEQVVIRVSQGWLVSAAMYTVPTYIPFANGSTISEAATASLLPRMLDPNKKGADARTNVNRFTFLSIGKRTTMGLGPLGEAWVNFGYVGGIATMFAFGLLLNLVYSLMASWSWYDDFFFYALPLVFLQAVKAETEFATIFNHLTKSLIVVLLTYHGLRFLGLLRVQVEDAECEPDAHQS